MALFGDLEEIIDSLVGGGPAWRQEEEEMCQLALTELTGDGIVWSKKQHNDFLVHKRLYRIFLTTSNCFWKGVKCIYYYTLQKQTFEEKTQWQQHCFDQKETC